MLVSFQCIQIQQIIQQFHFNHLRDIPTGGPCPLPPIWLGRVQACYMLRTSFYPVLYCLPCFPGPVSSFLLLQSNVIKNLFYSLFFFFLPSFLRSFLPSFFNIINLQWKLLIGVYFTYIFFRLEFCILKNFYLLIFSERGRKGGSDGENV